MLEQRKSWKKGLKVYFPHTCTEKQFRARQNIFESWSSHDTWEERKMNLATGLNNKSKGERERENKSCVQRIVCFCSRTSSSISTRFVPSRNGGCNFCVSLDNIRVT